MMCSLFILIFLITYYIHQYMYLNINISALFLRYSGMVIKRARPPTCHLLGNLQRCQQEQQRKSKSGGFTTSAMLNVCRHS